MSKYVIDYNFEQNKNINEVFIKVLIKELRKYVQSMESVCGDR